MTFARSISAAALLFALGTTTALAGDATADRAARQERRAPAQAEAAPADQGSGGGDCHRKDCCATSVTPTPEAPRFTDMG